METGERKKVKLYDDAIKSKENTGAAFIILVKFITNPDGWFFQEE